MTFTESINTCFTKYFTMKGRASRSEYWWFYLFETIFYLFDTVVNLILINLAIVSSLIGIAIVIPAMTVAVRRLHDIGKSGWWIFLWFVVKYLMIFALFLVLYMLFPDMMQTDFAMSDLIGSFMKVSLFVLLVGLVALKIIFVVLFATKGDAGDNKYGADPLNEK